jgi:hypothetical protein
LGGPRQDDLQASLTRLFADTIGGAVIGDKEQMQRGGNFSLIDRSKWQLGYTMPLIALWRRREANEVSARQDATYRFNAYMAAPVLEDHELVSQSTFGV